MHHELVTNSERLFAVCLIVCGTEIPVGVRTTELNLCSSYSASFSAHPVVAHLMQHTLKIAWSV